MTQDAFVVVRGRAQILVVLKLSRDKIIESTRNHEWAAQIIRGRN
jgi:hypothetical protein